MVGIWLLNLTVLFFVIAFLLFILPGKKNILGQFQNSIVWIPIIFNCLTYGYFAYLFLNHQFQFDYVYQYSNLSMPPGLLLASSWAGQAGSLFLWSFFCCLGLLIANKNQSWRKIVLPILLFHQIILNLLIWNAKPFANAAILFTDGLGMNPALSHILMIIHPPFAFLGYAFLSLLFAYSLASLINQKFNEWLFLAKKYALIALCCLSTTTILGSLWAYQVVGWGGYWSFDPIENGTLITCLLLLAFIHAMHLYEKQKAGLKLIYFFSILLYSSVIHMVLLIRSGLLKNLTQHSYGGTGLIYALMFTDIVTFVIPIFLLLLQSKKIKSKDLTVSFISKSGRNRVVIWLLLIMSGVLFLDLNQSLFNSYLSLSPTYFSSPLKVLFFAITLVTYLLLTFSSSPFAHSRSIRIHAWGKMLTEFLLSSLFVLLLINLLGMGLSKKTILLFILLFIPTLGVVKAIMDMRKLKWYSISKELSHTAICMLLISILLTNAYNRSETVCLEKNVPFTFSQYSIVLKNTTKVIPEFVGEKEQYTLDFSRGVFHFSAYPSIWRYERNKGPEKQIIPFVHILPDTDIIILPKQNGLKTLKLGMESNLKGSVITLKEYSKTTDSQGKNIEKAMINFQKEMDDKDGEPYLMQEDSVLTRRITQKGVPIERAFATPAIFGEEIEWISTENEHEIVISSPSISNMVEFDVFVKPYMLLLRFSYFLLLFSLIWFLLMSIWEKKIKVMYKKTHKNQERIRDHHTHHHHH